MGSGIASTKGLIAGAQKVFGTSYWSFAQTILTSNIYRLMQLSSELINALPAMGNKKSKGLGVEKEVFTTKIHALVDALGNPLKYIITPGQVADVTQADKLLADIVNAYVLGDKGYDSNDVCKDIRSRNCTPVIPGRSNRQKPIEYDKRIYKERHVVECFFSKIKQFRRIFSRFDKKLLNYFFFLCFSGAVIWLR